MARSDQDITLDEKRQEQPKNKDRARDPSSPNQAHPATSENRNTGKIAPGQQRQRHLSDKN